LEALMLAHTLAPRSIWQCSVVRLFLAAAHKLTFRPTAVADRNTAVTCVFATWLDTILQTWHFI
jgi:hypothetical protein